MSKKRLLFLMIFSILIAFSYSSHAAEYIDIDEAVKQRTCQYSLNGKAIVYSPFRTGSTLVYNILRFLFEAEKNFNIPGWGYEGRNNLVYKTHERPYFEANDIVFFTIRNPIDACLSDYIIRYNSFIGKNKKQNLTTEIMNKMIELVIQDQIARWKCLDKLMSENKNIVVLKFEKFNNNMNFILDELECLLGFRIDDHDRYLINLAYSKDNILNYTKKFKDFSSYDHTLFHGDHIDKGKVPVEHLQLVKTKITEALLFHKRIINKLGYDWIF